MKLIIGSDKSGFSAKEAIKAYLQENNIDFEDMGTQDLDHVKPFFEVASTVGPMIQQGKADRAILVCGTGAGMAIVANKYKGVSAVACESVYSAKMSRAINNAQIMSMGGWLVGPEMAVAMAKAFIETDFLQDLEEWRKGWLTNAGVKVGEIEDEIYN